MEGRLKRTFLPSRQLLLTVYSVYPQRSSLSTHNPPSTFPIIFQSEDLSLLPPLVQSSHLSILISLSLLMSLLIICQGRVSINASVSSLKPLKRCLQLHSSLCLSSTQSAVCATLARKIIPAITKTVAITSIQAHTISISAFSTV